MTAQLMERSEHKLLPELIPSNPHSCFCCEGEPCNNWSLVTERWTTVTRDNNFLLLK